MELDSEGMKGYGFPEMEEASIGLYSNNVQFKSGGIDSFSQIRTYPKQERYNQEINKKLRFYLDNKIPIKFRLIEPKNFYESKGNIIELKNGCVILEYQGTKLIHPIWEIDVHTIYPISYNPIIGFVRRAIPQERIDKVYYNAKYLCQLKLEGCSGKAECIDHIIPIANGGEDNIENLQASCIHCNSKKGTKVFY